MATVRFTNLVNINLVKFMKSTETSYKFIEIQDGYVTTTTQMGSFIRLYFDSGTTFPETPTCAVINTNTGSTTTTLNGTIDNDSNYVMFEFGAGYQNAPYEWQLTAVGVKPQTTKYKFTTTLENCTTNVDTTTEYDEGATVEVTVSANEGYYFATIPTIGGVEMTTTETEKPKNYRLTVTMNSDKAIVASAVVIPIPTPYHVWTFNTQGITSIEYSTDYGSTYQPLTEDLTFNNQYLYIKLNFVEGTTFATAPTLVIYDGSMVEVKTITGTTQESNNYYLFNVSNMNVFSDNYYTITAQGVAPVIVYHRFTTSLENCITNVDPNTDYIEGETIEVTVSANDGYYFSTVPTISGVEMTTTELERPKNYTLSVIMDSDKSIVASAVSLPETYTVTVTITNCSCSVSDGQSFEKGVDFTATLTPDSGYYFESTPQLVAHIQGADVYYNFVEGENGIWSLTVDGATTNLWSSVSGQNPSITANAQVIPSSSVTKYGFITLYKPSSDNMVSLANVRFYKDISGNYIDLGQYISNVYRTFFTIPTSKSATLNLGGYSTDINTPVIENDTITLNCGSVEVTGKYNNVMDYNNTTIEIFLPFVGIVTLDTSKCIGKTLTLTYIVNLVNGKGIITLIDNDNIIVYNGSCECTFKVPYKVNQLDTIQGDISIESNYLLGFTPYIIIRRDKSIDIPTKSDIGTIALATYNGYIKGRLLNNTILATEKEKAEIESLFNSGVYI